MRIRIKGYTFNLSEPFTPGTVITLGEAQALNDLRAENIQNNLRKLVATAQARTGSGQLIDQKTLEEIQAQLTQYDLSYKFQEKGASRLKLGDIEEEARAVARENLEAQARRQDLELTEAELEAAVELAVTAPAVLEEARARVEARRRAATGSLADL